MTDYTIFVLFLIGCACAFFLGCVAVDTICNAYKKRKAEKIEFERLKKENRRLEMVIDFYEIWNMGL